MFPPAVGPVSKRPSGTWVNYRKKPAEWQENVLSEAITGQGRDTVAILSVYTQRILYEKRKVNKMARECFICGKKPVAGRNISRRGLAKSKGGVGQRVTGITKRRFIPNIQNVNALIDGKKKKIKVCAKCLKAGKVTKAI